jgi:hypothetical protein
MNGIGDGEMASTQLEWETQGDIYRLVLIDAVDHAHADPAFDKSPFGDRDLDLAILAAHRQRGPVIGSIGAMP